MIPVKAILFDFDGTIADTAPGIVITMKETFRRMDLPIPSDEAVRQTIGLLLKDGIQKLGSLSDEDAARGLKVYRDIYPEYELPNISIFPGVADTLARLSDLGIRKAVCTSRGKGSLDIILSQNGLSDCFETCITESDHLTPKPAPDMALALMQRMGLSPDETLVVGDTTFDILMGSRAGCRTAAVTYGNHSLPQLLTASPTYVLDRFPDLLKVFSPQ